MYLHAIRSPLLWHINSIAESIIRSAMFKPSWSSAFRHRLEAFRKSSMHGLVFRTGSLKSNSKYKKGLWLIKYIGDENDKAFLLLLLVLKSALEKFQITFFFIAAVEGKGEWSQFIWSIASTNKKNKTNHPFLAIFQFQNGPY